MEYLKDSDYRGLLDELYDGVYFVDNERRILYWNRAAEQLTGFSADEILGRHCYDGILCHTNDEGVQLCTEKCPLQRCIESTAKQTAEVYLRHKLGNRVSVNVRIAPILDDAGKVVGAIEIFHSNSAVKELQRHTDELNRIAYFDPLTGLVNRRYLDMRLEQACREYDLFSKPAALALFDIDHFKAVNDSYGHSSGDSVLSHIGQLLAGNVRATDTVGRWGGEEFLAIFMESDLARAVTLAERCRGLISAAEFTFDGEQLHPTISAGVTSFQPGDRMDTVLKRADKALYESKSKGRNRVTAG